jgi:hypothetical protein
MATITITVTVAGGKFVLDGVSQATYSATPGNTYKFDQAEGTNATHPLRLSTTSDGTHNSGSAYTDGVTTNGTPGSAGAYTQIVVDATTVQSLFYYCSSHSGMGGAFNVGSSETVQYQDRAGFAVQNRTTDPVPFAQEKIDNPYIGTWSSGGNLNRDVIYPGGTVGGGNNSSALAFGGYESSARAFTESYNGTAWTEVNDLNTARYGLGGRGTTTAALGFGGTPGSGRAGETEKWDGSSWTESGDLATARYRLGGIGTQTAAIGAGGENAAGSNVDVVEQYNGTSWTEIAEINTARNGLCGGGSTTAGLVFGGEASPGVTGNTESWNGSAWTEVNDMNTGRMRLASADTSASDLIAIAGGPPNTSNTENFDGTSWTEVNNLATARHALGGSGVATSALAFGGEPPGSPDTNATEEWAFTGIAPDAPAVGYSESIVGDIYYNSGTGEFKAIKSGGAPVGTWASGGNTNTGRRYLGGVGTKTAGLIFGGANPGNIANTEQYNGTAWTEVNDLNSAQIAMGTAGTSTSGMSALGATPPNTRVEDWNGTSWSSNPHSLNSGRQFPGGDGPSNDSAIMVGGEPSPNGALTEIYNGSTWTEVNDLNSGRNQLAVVGTTTAALAVGGSPVVNDAESWDGTSWTEVADLSNGEPGLCASGDSALAIAFAGAPGFSATNEAWNGTSWAEVGDLATGRNFAASSNNPGSTEAFIASGEAGPGYLTATEEWTAADFEIKTVTTS